MVITRIAAALGAVAAQWPPVTAWYPTRGTGARIESLHPVAVEILPYHAVENDGSRMASKKTPVFQRMFENRWDPVSKTANNPVVKLEEVADAIAEYNVGKTGKARLSAKNPANFYKDFTRKVRSANENWPESVVACGYTAVGLTGESRCFKFIPIPDGRGEPFEDVFPKIDGRAPHPISSASLPLAARQLSRGDEPALIQTIVRLRVIETHLSLFSPLKKRLVQVDHIQNSVKLRDSEIDALFLAILKREGGGFETVLVTCEAKQRGEDLMLEQVSRQPFAAFQAMPTYETVLALGARSFAPSQIQIVEFKPVRQSFFKENDPLEVVGSKSYTLKPAVDGIGGTVKGEDPDDE